MAENRIDLLQGKNELTTEELYRIIEFKHEFSSNDFLKKYTEKPFRKLNSEEKSKLVEELLKADYLNYKKCYIARSKLLYDTSETLEKEISIIEKLNDLGYEVYLLPYGYARDSMNCYLKSADSITNGNFLEFKTVISTGKYAGQSVYAEGRKQADNIFISLLNETSEQKVVNNIYKVINEKKRLNKLTNREEDFSGLIYLNFEKNNKTVLYRFEKDGKALRLDNPTFDNLKKCLSDIANTQVQENPITEYGSSPQKSINEGNLSVNNFLKVFGGSKVSLNYDGKNIQGKIMLSDGSSVEIEPFEISESELNDCWYGFTYKGKDFDINISLNDTENEGTPVCIYPVINGTTLTTSDFAAIKKDSVFFEKQIANEIINNQMENKTMEKILTWDEIYRAAEGKAGEDWALKVYDNARAYIGSYAKEHFGIDIEASEIPEDAIDDFLKEHPELNRFNESGQMLAVIDSENEILNKPFIPSEYVLNKLQEKGIEVITDKAKFDELLKASEILKKMEGDKKENLSDKYFQANQSEAEAFSKELDAFIADYDKTQKTINPLKMLNVGAITPVMKLLGIADVPIGIDQSTISKALREEPIYPDDEQGHKLTIDELKNIPQSLADPVMVFRSDSPTRRNKDSYVFFTEQRDFKNRSIIIPVAVNKKYGRLVINKVTSIYGRNQEIRYVKDNIQRGNLVYFDKKRSLEWERECKVQFLAQVLPIEGSINNILSKDSLVKFLDSKSEKMVKDGTTYGFTHNNKIYLNPDIMNSEAAVHEYTHLWDNLTRKENPMLWNKGLEIFKGTSIWNEVINDEHYQNIKDDENLVLSECHARITGKVAETVLNRIAELDGNEKQADMINWDKETINFIFENYRDVFEKNSFNSVAEFTTATMKDLFSPVEQQKQDIAIDSSAFERMEKFFEGKTSSLGNGDYQNFKELYDWVQEEFPSKDSEHVLLETVSRMIYSNINFGDLEPASYDDVYGFGDGAEHRFDVSDDIAKRLINNEISADWMTIQNEVNDFACRKLMDLKENTPDMLVTDTINEAFEISKKYEPIAEKNLNAYTKSEKTQNIRKALENIKKTYTEDSHDIRIDYGTGIFGADLEALIKGNDAAIYGEKSLDFVRPDRASLELGIEDKIPFKDLIRGYGDNFVSNSEGVKVPRHIERWDYMEVFNSDYDAAQQWKLETGGKLLENGKNIWISDENLEYFYYPDTPENRVALKEYLLPQSLEFNWDNFTEEEFNEVKEEITSGNIKEDYKGQVYVGSVCVQFTITDKESNWVDYNNFILGEKGEGEISGIPYSYQNGKQVVMNTFTENSYENFKTVIENVLIEDMGKDSHLKQEAMRKTINWTTINENNKEAALKLWKEKEGITEEELEHIREQITYNIALTNLDFNNEEHVQKVKEMFGKDFDVSNDEAKVLLSYATCFGDGTHEYGLSKDGHLHFRTNQDNEGWSFITEDSMLTDFLTSAFDGAAILLDSDKTNDATLLNSFLNKNQTLLNDLDNNKLYELSLIDIKSKLQEIDENTKNFIVTHSVTFPCGFTFPPDLNNEAEMDAYRESQIEKIKEKYGCNDNEIESEIFDIDDPKNASFNIHFAVPVPEEISDNLEKVNEWIEGVENFVKEECGCTFINWQGGERNETVYENAKEYKMEKERKSDFANPNAEIMNVLSDALADSFNTLDYNPDYWQNLLDRGADPTRAIRIAAADANLADNLNWLLDNVPDERLKEIFSDKSYADEVFDIAKESVIHDEDSWNHISDVGFSGFKRIAVLCERETEADCYYGECLEKLYKVPVEPKITQLLDTPELLAEKMNANRIHQNEPEITESLAKAILDYCTFENIKFYCDNNEDIFSLDVSEDYTGEGMKESNFGIAANGIEYANKAKDYAYSIYNEETYNVVKDLWEKEKIFANPAQTQNEKQISFINDEEKMKDFPNISKEEFLSSYSYLSEEEYDATAKDYNELNQAAVPSRFSDTVKTVEDINKIYDRNLDFIEQNISFKYSNPQFNEIDEIEKWKNGELFIPLEDRNGNYTTDTEANTLEEYNSYANKNFKTYFEVIKYQAELKAKFLDSAIENSITEYLRREYAETSPNSARFEVTVENQSYPIDKEGLDFITDTNEWGSADDRLNEVIDRRFEEEIEQKEIDIVSDVLEYISQETNGNLVLKNTELSDVLFSDELIQIYSPKQEFLAIQPEETKAALIEAGIARGELYNNVEKEYDATANELKEHGRTGLQTVKALAYKNVMDKNYLAYDNRLEKSGSEADKIQSAIERLTDVSLPAVAGEIGKSEQEVAEIISALLDAKDYVEERFNVVRPTADEIIEKVRDEVSWADILKTELSWKELGLNPEDYDRTESGTETEKDFKEWAMGLELENALDLHGFDTALEGVSSWNNSTISEQKWMIIDKLSEEIVSGKLKIENSQDAFDKLLKENEVYKGFVQKGIVKDDVFGLREITEKDLKSVSAKEPVSEKARDEMLSANFAGHGGLTQKAFADNGIEIDIETANALENCFSQIEAITKYTADGHDLFKEGNGVDTIRERSIEYSEKEKAWIIHEKNWLALSAIKGNEAAPDDYMEKADRAVDRNWSINCEELVKFVYNEIKEDGEIEKEFPDTFKKLENLKDYTESLTEAKQLISDFCFDEYMSTPTFDNLKDVGLAYTTFEDPYTHEEYEIQTSADLVNCEITTKVNDKIADSMEYDSLKDMVINSLNTLDFDNLVYVPSSKLDELLKEERESVEKTLLEKSDQIIAETFNEPALAKRAKLYVPSDYGYDADNKIHILVEFDNNAKHEDDLFNALAERHLVLPNGREVDFNPIKPEKSGTIEQYLDSLEKIKLGKVVVSKENFRKVFNEVIKLPKYKDKPLEAAGFCFSRVPKENKAEVAQWLSNLGCKTKIDTNDLFNKWNMENNPKPNINKSINKSKSREADDWSISD